MYVIFKFQTIYSVSFTEKLKKKQKLTDVL